jgi:BirA family transcriptional regulator, biotin operon repressor / biotin---[acetyl-CoA-carboxylase] ligase
MDQSALERLLSDLPLGSIRYFHIIASTNDLAARWAEAGAPDLALVAADEQTAGRGRLNRHWFTPPGSALAFSLILKPGKDELASQAAQLSALGALAVCDTLNTAFSPTLPAQVKWPNDVVATRRKLAGVLAETHWHGDQPLAVILGIGINVAPDSVPPDDMLSFPATCVEAVLEKTVDRWSLLHAVLAKLLELRQWLGSPDFIQAWERRLAFRGEWVQLVVQDQPPVEGQVLGLFPDGALKLKLRSGEVRGYQIGEVRLRPVDKAI